MLPVNESDWKLFRKRLPEWQERCMEQLAESYAALLAGPGKASDKFWELEKRLRKDKKRVGVDTEFPGILRVECVLSIDESSYSPGFLGISNRVQSDCGLS